ncbi:MAG TPA: hypothetical protein VMV09_00675 [Candidatus Saccharimonadales bacterium]|nr:hypothetical protein [Candidatus Saccharimonadales bacterium]
MRQVQRRGRDWLAAPFDALAFQPGGPNLPDLNHILGAKGELLTLLARVPDLRNRRGA